MLINVLFSDQMKGSRVINCIANSFDDVVSILILCFFCKNEDYSIWQAFVKQNCELSDFYFVFMVSLIGVSIGTRSTFSDKNEKS